MDGETIVAIVAAVIAASGGGVAIWQANVAKDQAATSRRAADAAEQQAASAREQVEIMRQQLAADEADRNRQDAPEIELVHAGFRGNPGSPTSKAEVELTVTRSPGPVDITITDMRARTDDVLDGSLPLPVYNDTYEARTGTTISLILDLNLDALRMQVDITMLCKERDGSRSWPISQSVTIDRGSRSFVG